MTEHLKNQIEQLPSLPGIYKYFDNKGNIIYIGKAKDLKKRVSSYFTSKQNESAKTKLLVKKIASVEYIVVNNEHEALLLENNLIKEHQPRFNIQLRDDKTFPWICIKNERFPRVFSTRNLIHDGSEYFGPYSNVFAMKTLLRLIKNVYKLRTCNYHLSDDNIKSGKFKVCLDYHIGTCAAPCIGLQSEEKYNQSVEQIKNIIKGDIQPVLKVLKTQMLYYAEKLQFEKAQEIKEQIEIIEKYKAKATVVSPKLKNLDVFHILNKEKTAYVSYLKINQGAIVQGQTVEIRKKLNETPEQLLSFAILEMRERFKGSAKEIVVPFIPEELKNIFNFTVPKRDDKKKLLDLALKNA
ncbi:MAG: excinuclease ABC subunit C, partial [Bacteroidetes bacterium]